MQFLDVKTSVSCDNNTNVTNATNFSSLEAVDRGSETQLQVTENLNWIPLGSLI